MKKRTLATKLLGSVLVFALLFILAACGGGGSSPAGGTNTPATPPAETPATPEPPAAEPAPAEVKWPTKDIRFIVPVSPGGGMDTSARLLAKYWQEQAGVNVVVENIPGAEYNNAIFEFLKAKADGHTVILFPGVIANQLFGGVNYDLNEFDWVGRISASAQVGIVSKSSGITSLKDMIDKGTIKGGVTGLSSSQTIGQLLSGKEMGFKIEPITHKGSTEAILSVIRGDADWTTSPDITVKPYVENGDVVPIYVAAEKRLELFPDVPTLVELGFPQVLPIVAFDRIVATNPDTDPAVLEKLRENFKQAVENPEFVEEYTKLGDAPSYLDGEGTAENVRKALKGIAPNVDYLNSFK